MSRKEPASRAVNTRVALYSGYRGCSGKTIAPFLMAMGVPFSTVNEGHLRRNELEGYSAIIFPGGHSVQAGRKADENVKRFVRRGGGFLGICAGLHYAADLGLLDIDLCYMRGGGYHKIRIIKRHPVTRGYALVPERAIAHKVWSPVKYTAVGRVHINRANGGMIVQRKGNDLLLATYDDTDLYGAVAAGGFGKGRVVVMSPHPEGSEPPGPEEAAAHALPLLVNAVGWVTRKRIAPLP